MLGVAGGLAAVPLSFFSYQPLTAGGPDAVLGWPLATAALLLHMRRWEPGRSETTPLAVFGSGLVALLLALGATFVK